MLYKKKAAENYKSFVSNFLQYSLTTVLLTLVMKKRIKMTDADLVTKIFRNYSKKYSKLN